MKSDWQTLFLKACIVIAALIIMLYPFFLKQPSFKNMAEECMANCKKNGQFGRIVEQEGRFTNKLNLS